MDKFCSARHIAIVFITETTNGHSCTITSWTGSLQTKATDFSLNTSPSAPNPTNQTKKTHHKNAQLLNLLGNSTSLIGRRGPHRGRLSIKANPAKREMSQHCGLLETETTTKSHLYGLYAINKTNRGTSMTTFESYHYYLHNTNNLVSPGHSCAKGNGNSSSSTGALNFRSQATCPVQPGGREDALPTRLPLELGKSQHFKSCPRHLQLFPCVEQVSSISFIRHLKEQANTKHTSGEGGDMDIQHTQIRSLSSPEHLFSQNSEQLTVSEVLTSPNNQAQIDYQV